jgi:mono/diheme cytochrome c family protein
MIHHVRRAGLWPWLIAVPLLLVGSQTCSNRSQAEQRGQELFQHHCTACHEASNLELKKQPPRLEGLFQSKTLPSGAPATDEQVRKTIIKGIGTMPAFDQRLSDEDVDDLVKYLHALK